MIILGSSTEINSFQLRAVHLLNLLSLPVIRRPLPPTHTRSGPSRLLLRNVAAQQTLVEITTMGLGEAVIVAVETVALATKAAEVSVMLDVVASLLVGVVEAISPPRAVASLRWYDWPPACQGGFPLL